MTTEVDLKTKISSYGDKLTELENRIAALEAGKPTGKTKTVVTETIVTETVPTPEGA